jgi:hypothetical protein
VQNPQTLRSRSDAEELRWKLLACTIGNGCRHSGQLAAVQAIRSRVVKVVSHYECAI